MCFSFESRIHIGSTSLVVHLHDDLPCEQCMLQAQQKNLLSLSCPPNESTSVAVGQPKSIPKKKKLKTNLKSSVVALPCPVAPVDIQEDDEQDKPHYIDRAKLRRNYYGHSANPPGPPASASLLTPSTSPATIYQPTIVSSGIHAKSMSMLTPRAGIGSEKLVDEEERAKESEMDWREKVREKARNRFRTLE